MSSHQPHLPSDIIFDIVTRAPSLQTLDTCKAVSKDWNQLIHERNFMHEYCKKTNNLSGYFVQDLKCCNYVSTFVSTTPPHDDSALVEKLPGSMRIMASCKQGILICVRRTGRNYQYYVCKPATRQWCAIPNPKLRYATVGVGVMVLKANPLRYKIVRLSQLGIQLPGYCTYRSEIFDSETWRWRRIQDVKLPYYEFVSNRSPSICIANCIYWLTSEDNVIKFNEVDQSFDMFALPEEVHSNSWKKLVAYQDYRLGFTCVTEEDNMELWLVKDGAEIFEFYKVQDWFKRDEELRLANDHVFQFRSDLELVNLTSR